MPGFSHEGRKNGEFLESLWPALKENKEISLVEALCYDEGTPTIRHISEYAERLAKIIERERPDGIIAHSMGGLALIKALGILNEKQIYWKGKIVFVETPFNGAPKWKLKYTGFPVNTPAVRDMFRNSGFMQMLNFSVLKDCQVLCILGAFSNVCFGIIGWLAKPVMDPHKRFIAPQVYQYPKIEHNELLQDKRVASDIDIFLLFGGFPVP